jgi:hypothetical protein
MRSTTYVVKGIHGKETILYEAPGVVYKGIHYPKYFILKNGALGENDGSLKEINPTRAHTLIKYMKS